MRLSFGQSPISPEAYQLYRERQADTAAVKDAEILRQQTAAEQKELEFNQRCVTEARNRNAAAESWNQEALDYNKRLPEINRQREMAHAHQTMILQVEAETAMVKHASARQHFTMLQANRGGKWNSRIKRLVSSDARSLNKQYLDAKATYKQASSEARSAAHNLRYHENVDPRLMEHEYDRSNYTPSDMVKVLQEEDRERWNRPYEPKPPDFYYG